MRDYIIKRVALFVPTMVLATMLIFALFWMVPGDVALMILGGEETGGNISLEDLENFRHQLGLDRPIYTQYATWLWDVVRGDLGDSLWYRVPVWDHLRDRFVVTLELAIMAILMAFVVAVPLGVIAAVKQNTTADYASRTIALLGIAMPTFWLGLLVIYFLVFAFGWLPPLRYADVWDNPLLNLQQLVFPAMTLAFHDLAFTARVTRSSMLEVMREDYVRTARAKGLAEWAVLGRHALKNAILPVITISGYQFGRLLAGVIIVESIFVVPGMGVFLIEAIQHRDFVVIQAIVFLIAVVVLSLNLLIDLAYGFFDPRIRYT